MRVVVYEPNTNQTILARALEPGESMDPRSFAEAVTRRWGGRIDDGPGHVAACAGDLRVEFRDDEGAVGTGRSFFLA